MESIYQILFQTYNKIRLNSIKRDMFVLFQKKSNMTTNNEMTLLNWLLGPEVYQCISLPNPWNGFMEVWIFHIINGVAATYEDLICHVHVPQMPIFVKSATHVR